MHVPENAAFTFYTDAGVPKPNHRDRAKLMGIPLAQRPPDYRSVNAGRTHLKPPLPSNLCTVYANRILARSRACASPSARN